ncbi:MAG TPA: hypothetical protein VGB00_20125 [Pyrinomonadaceae bacterium]
MKAIFSALLFCLLSGVSAFSQEAQKFDYFEDVPCDEYLGRMDAAIAHARQNPTATTYVLIYEGKARRYNNRTKKTELAFPAYGSAAAKILSIKNYLSKRNFPVKRFSFVKAGFRENAAVEIWTVPVGATPPKPTPTITKMKYRKGKAYGFCTDCCGE